MQIENISQSNKKFILCTILYRIINRLLNKQTIWSSVLMAISPRQGIREHMLGAIGFTRTTIMLKHVLHVTELYVGEWYFVVGLEG